MTLLSIPGLAVSKTGLHRLAAALVHLSFFTSVLAFAVDLIFFNAVRLAIDIATPYSAAFGAALWLTLSAIILLAIACIFVTRLHARQLTESSPAMTQATFAKF